MIKDERDLLSFQEAIFHVVEESDHEIDIYIQNDECCGEGIQVLLDARVRDEGKVSQSRIFPFSV